MLHLTLKIAVLACCSTLCFAGTHIQGSVPVNSGTFDKLVNKFKVSLIKFDEAYPFGDKQDEFKKISEAAIGQPDLLIGELNIEDFGEKENADIADRYGVKKEDGYPRYLLFRQTQPDPVFYSGQIKADDIKRFVVAESGLWLGLPGMVHVMDEKARQFVNANSEQDRANVIDESKKLLLTMTDKKQKDASEFYIKTFEKMTEKGADVFIPAETKRIQKLANGKVSEAKKIQLKERLNVLQSIESFLKAASSKKSEL